MAQFIAYSIGVFLVVIILLVIILLVAKKYLSPSGNVNITVNGDKVLNVPQGNNLMATLNQNGIFLPSACGGKASCGQCKVQVLEGGGEILDSEKPHFTRKQSSRYSCLLASTWTSCLVLTPRSRFLSSIASTTIRTSTRV